MTSRHVVEFYGMARHKARRAEMEVNASTLGELLAQVVEACPELADLCGPGGTLGPAYLVSIGGEKFVGDPTSALGCERVLILSADAGG